MAEDGITQTPVEQWLTSLDVQGKSRSTIEAYRRAVCHFAHWSETSYGQMFDVSLIIARDVRDWKSYQQTVEKAAPATINLRLTALTRFFDWAESQKLVRANPAKGISGVRLVARQPKALSAVELRRLLRAAHASGDLRDIAMIEFLAGTGLRVSELLTLQLEDVNIQPRSGHVIVRKGKHGQTRTVPLTASVRNALSAYLQIHPHRDDPRSSIWWGERGALTDRRGVARILEKYASQARIEAFGPHTLRHTFATQYLAANPSDARGLAELLGHGNLETVMIYTQPTIDDLADRMQRLETHNISIGGR